MSLARAVLHIEGFAIFAGATWAFFALIDGSWVAFLLLLFVPDVSIGGYLANTRTGALTYDAIHNEALAIAITGLGLVLDDYAVIGLGLILAAHVGLDRMLGFGLKDPTRAFGDTHLQRL